MKIRQFRYGADNLGYLICGQHTAIAVDGGAVDAITAYVQRHGLVLKAVTNTHGHADHTSGNRELMERTGAPYVNSLELSAKGNWRLEDISVHLHRTPGHSHDAVVFQVGRYLLTGDTVFNGTVGNCFTGDLEGFYRSIQRLLQFDEDCLVYAGHDYVADAAAFAKRLEPENPHLDRWMARYNPEHVYSRLKDEKRVNPFLRFNEPSIVALLEKKGLAVSTEFERFTGVMRLG